MIGSAHKESVEAISPLPRRWAVWLLAIFSGQPLANVLSIYAFAWRAHAHLGYWPQPNKPDPKSLPFEWHHFQAMLGLIIWPFIAFFCGTGILTGRMLWRDFPMWRLLVWWGLCVGLSILVPQMDPGHFFNWFMD